MDSPARSALALFHPVIQEWFAGRLGEPTDVQRRAWPEIASGRHVLVTAPTGSGKTLSAFLWAVHQLLTGAWETPRAPSAGRADPAGAARSTRVLYVSPLKALNNDIQRNLLGPLTAIRHLARSRGLELPEIEVLTRSGDTPAAARQRMVRRPPQILITTPESLNLILASPRAREMLGGIRTVILDEIHAVVSTKRGTHLITAVDRLVLLAGEFQRIALSATVRPVETVAAFVGGFRRVGAEETGDADPGTTDPSGAADPDAAARGLVADPGAAGRDDGPPGYRPRPVVIIRSPQAKLFQVEVRSARGGSGHGGFDGEGFAQEGFAQMDSTRVGSAQADSVWAELAARLKEIIRSNRSTLVFVNARRLAERLARLINEGESRELAWAHHGSLSRELRLAVEARLKNGELPAIIATSSLELGIDIGDLDQVVLVQTPFSVASGLQRIGRAGHAVGRISRGIIFATHGLDYLAAAVMARGILEQDIEEARPVRCPLDVLTQVILAMTGLDGWSVDDLYAVLRASYPYRSLSREQFDGVLEMLAGRYADSRVRELSPRIYLDRIAGTVRGRANALRLVYSAGGTIPDRGYFELRMGGSGARIGELDEEFVWERRLGDTFTLGSQSWRIQRIGDREVEVGPWTGPLNSFPFWRAERPNREFRFTERMALFLERWGDRLDDPGLAEELRRGCGLSEEAVTALCGFLARQRAALGGLLPHRRRLVIEHSAGSPGQTELRRVFLHTLWGGRVNGPLGLLLSAAWEERFGGSLEAFADDACLLLLPPAEADEGVVEELLQSVASGGLERLLRRKLESSGFFGARFRENAGRALLLPRGGPRRRMPLWITRMRSRRLLAAVAGYEDFPILAETWRTCFQDEFDLESLRILLDEVAGGEIRLAGARTAAPSPFASGLLWVQVNQHLYDGDEPGRPTVSALRPDVLREAVFSAELRPRVEPALVRVLEARLQRTAAGYEPRQADELVQWVGERLLVPEPEWEALLSAMDGGGAALEGARSRLIRVRPPGSLLGSIAALEALPRLRAALGLTGREVEPLDGGPMISGSRMKSRGPAASGPALLSGLLAEWLRSYGPVPRRRIGEVFGLEEPRLLQAALDMLLEAGTVVVDRLTREAAEAEVCDAENLERLLRLARSRARPSFRALPAESLPHFLATWQGLVGASGAAATAGSAGASGTAAATPPGVEPAAATPAIPVPGADGVEKLKTVLERLFGYVAPAGLWETDILPARLHPYYMHWLDALAQGGELLWYGCGRGRIGFCLADDYELFHSGGSSELIPGGGARYPFWELADRGGLSSEELARRLWAEFWRGRVSNDSLQALRRGIGTGFRVEERRAEDQLPGAGEAGRRSRRMTREGFSRWRSARPSEGRWFSLDPPARAGEGPTRRDALDVEELNRDRARQLLSRYGIVFRELLENEAPALRWGGLFRALRLMELSGEILAGHFFQGVQGLQFMSPSAFRLLEGGLAEDGVFWMNALDPASPCGLGLPGIAPPLPPRHPTTHLVFQGARLLMCSRRRGRELEIHAGPEDPALRRAFGLFRIQLGRDFQPWTSVRVETINGRPARESPYGALLREAGFAADFKAFILRG